jgi:hypothetical protein
MAISRAQLPKEMDGKLRGARKAKNGLWANINRRKRLGISRSKSKSTISKEAYANMKKGFPKKKAQTGKLIEGELPTTKKEYQGPMEREGYAIEPQVRGSTSFDQNIEKQTKGASLYLHTPIGRAGIHYDKDTDRFLDNSKVDTKRKGISYDVQKDIGPGTLTASTSMGTSENEYRRGKTKQGTISYTIPLGKAKGGSVRGARKELRGTKFKGIF